MMHQSSILNALTRCVLVAAVLGGTLAASAVSMAAQAVDQRTAVNDALAWLRTQQQDDGSFPSAFGSPAGLTTDAVFALVAAGEDPNLWKTTSEGSHSVIHYLASIASEHATSANATARLIIAAVAAGQDPTNFGGLNLADTLQSFYDNGNFGSSAFDQAWALIALAATRQTIPPQAIATLLADQLPDGGWESGPGWGSDTNTTALALQALVAAAQPTASPPFAQALAFFQTQQMDDGGFPYVNPNPWGETASDANSTAYSIQGLIAAGQNPRAEPWLTPTGDPLSALLSFQLPSGALEWQPSKGEDILATVQAIPALLGRTFPLRTAGLYRVCLPVVTRAVVVP